MGFPTELLGVASKHRFVQQKLDLATKVWVHSPRLTNSRKLPELASVNGLPSLPFGGIGVLFGCLARRIDGFPWFAWWFNHPPGPIYFP